MCGATLILAVGCHRTQGWGIAAMAACAAALPDWDGASIAFGGSAYAKVHRVWGHNILVAGGMGALVGGIGYLAHLSTRFRRKLSLATARFWPRRDLTAPTPVYSGHALLLWCLIGVLAGLVHLPADIVYSGHPEMRSWPVPLLWPFTDQGCVWPLVNWGDITSTLIFVAAMFGVYFWPKRTQLIAVLALAGVLGYICIRWLFI